MIALTGCDMVVQAWTSRVESVGRRRPIVMHRAMWLGV